MRRAVQFTGPGSLTVEHEPVPEPGAGEVLVRTELSAVSPGTELLVYRGQVPEDLAVDQSLPALSGRFSYPLRYGYAAVGEVVECGEGVDPAVLGESVFGFNPHESHFVAAVEDLHPVPSDLDPETAVLFPTAETAVTLVMDSGPVVGEHVAVFGQGLVGLHTTALLASFPLGSLTVVDPVASRRQLGLDLGADRAVAPERVAETVGPDAGTTDTAGPVSTGPDSTEDGRSASLDGPPGIRGDGVAPSIDTDGGAESNDDASAESNGDFDAESNGDFDAESNGDSASHRPRPGDGLDLAVELSGNPPALDDAIAATGYGGRVVVGSWYGTKRANLDLGGRFHRSRISVRSSQVSTIDPSYRGRWDRSRRAAAAWDHLRSFPVERLPTRQLPIERAAAGYDLLGDRPDDAVGVLFTYE